jgi:hypothetical protein
MIKAVSFIPARGVPEEDYRDFLGREMQVVNLKSDLKTGVLPPGLIFQDHEGRCAQVIGSYGYPQRLEYLMVQEA